MRSLRACSRLIVMPGFAITTLDVARMPSPAIKNKIIKGNRPVRIHEYHASQHSCRFSSANRATLSSYRVISGRVNTNYSPCSKEPVSLVRITCSTMKA